MLKDTFPELLHGKPAPQNIQTLELSRFVVRAQRPGNSTFSDITLQAIREVVRFSLNRQAHQLLTVTTVGVERMLKKTGISMTRFGPSLRIGIEQAVALSINLDEKTLQALFGASGVWPSHLAYMGDNPCANASTLCHNTDRGPTQAAVPQGPT